MAEEVKVEQKVEEKLLTQAQVDAIVQDRIARERGKYSDYDDLKKFRTEHDKQLNEAKTKELEAKQEYEKLKEGWMNKEKEYSDVISKKESEIVDMRVSGALMNEIVKQNAYAEETMALIRNQAVFHKENNLVTIKGKDSNGLEKEYSIEEGIKQFLTQRPHLVKAQKPGGGGTPPSGGGGANVGGQDLMSLNVELQQAMSRGDTKKVNELKPKIRALAGI